MLSGIYSSVVSFSNGREISLFVQTFGKEEEERKKIQNGKRKKALLKEIRFCRETKAKEKKLICESTCLSRYKFKNIYFITEAMF